MKNFKYIIVGGGVVAGYAVQEFIKHPQYKKGDLAIITNDNAIPYERPPLSKDFLAGGEYYEDIQINPPRFYRNNGIHLYLYTAATQIKTTENVIHTDHGDVFHYEKLLLATGSSAKKLDVPGSDSSYIKYLRTIDDARAIRDSLADANDIVVVGGGYIGMESAASLTQDGHKVTMVFPEKRLMPNLFTEELSTYFEQYYKDHGVTFIKGATVESFKNSSTRQIILSSGKCLNADMVVVGIGATPNLKIIDKSSIQTDDGVIVNTRLQTSVKNIYAAGDIANYFDVLFEKRRRVEHWQNAVDMAQYAAREMLGVEQDDFQTVRYFFSDIFDLSYEFWGDIDGANQIIHTGDFNKDSLGVWWLKSNRVVASLLINRPHEREKAQEWIRNKKTVNPDAIMESIQFLTN